MALELIVLFIEGHPVVYELQKKRNLFLFSPLTSWTDEFVAESFTLQKTGDNWQASGIEDRNVIDQAIEEIEKRSF